MDLVKEVDYLMADFLAGKDTEMPIFLRCGSTDMRKSINGLAIIVDKVLKLDPFLEAFFVFCNHKKDKLKILRWGENGFWLHYKRLEKGHFNWPQSEKKDTMEVSAEDFQWILDSAKNHHRSRKVSTDSTGKWKVI